MNLYTSQRKGDEMSSQKYDKDITGQCKKIKSTLPKIASPDIMKACEVREGFPDDTYAVVIEYFVNKNMDDVFRKMF